MIQTNFAFVLAGQGFGNFQKPVGPGKLFTLFQFNSGSHVSSLIVCQKYSNSVQAMLKFTIQHSTISIQPGDNQYVLIYS